VTQAGVDSLLRLAAACAKHNTLILVFANNNYLDVLLNWLIAVHRLGISNYLVVSLDEQIHSFLAERGFPSALMRLQGSLAELWNLRVQILHELCAHGTHVIHSDADAVWLRDPIPAFFSQDADHLVISQGTIWPEDCLRKQGFVLCCGLFYLRSSAEALTLMDQVMKEMVNTSDDQVTLNHLVSASVTWTWDSRRTYEFVFRGRRVLCSEEPIRGRASETGLRVTMLPHHLFQRVHMPSRSAYVKHLIRDKTAETMLANLQKTGCLFLRPDWRSQEFTAATILRIAASGAPEPHDFA
jgi:hypothetical protein